MSHASLYAFLARVFHHPADNDLLELVSEIPELDALRTKDLSDSYTWLFEFNVYPYASIFIDPSGMLNSDWAGFVTGVYDALGLDVNLGAGVAASDHLSAQLEALTTLCEREEHASTEEQKTRALHDQRVLLVEHILPWLASFVWAIQRIDNGFYSECAQLTLDVCLDHADSLMSENQDLQLEFTFPAIEEDLKAVQPINAKQKAGEARSKLQSLITPARSGLFLSRQDIIQLGRRLDLPVRFAERPFMLENLFSSAADADKLTTLFQDWLSLLDQERQNFTELQENHKTLGFIWQAWQEKIAVSQSYLKELELLG